MTDAATMTLCVLLQGAAFLRQEGVAWLLAENHSGSFGVLPHRRDGVAALVPSILTFEVRGIEQNVAVDEGVLVKTGLHVYVAVRRAVQGADLSALRGTVEREFRRLDEHEQSARAVMAKLETSLVQRLLRLGHVGHQ